MATRAGEASVNTVPGRTAPIRDKKVHKRLRHNLMTTKRTAAQYLRAEPREVFSFVHQLDGNRPSSPLGVVETALAARRYLSLLFAHTRRCLLLPAGRGVTRGRDAQ